MFILQNSGFSLNDINSKFLQVEVSNGELGDSSGKILIP